MSKEKLKLFKFEVDWGRGFDVESVFISTKRKVNNLLDKTIYFGEICGKHSEIEHTIEKGDINELKVADTTITDLTKIFGETISGNNPIQYYRNRNE